MAYVIGLQCHLCKAMFPAQALWVCDKCLGPLEVIYDYDKVRHDMTRAKIESRAKNLWRYRELLFFLVWRDIKVRYKQAVLGVAIGLAGALDALRWIDETIEDAEIRRITSSGGHLPMLACRGIDFSYGQLQVLFNVDFSVDDGEMVALLWEGGDLASAVELEDLWNDIRSQYDFDLLCAYRLSTFDNEDAAQAFRRVCEQHDSRPEQLLLAELAYADAVATVINCRASTADPIGVRLPLPDGPLPGSVRSEVTP